MPVTLKPYPYQAEALDALETKRRVAFAHGYGVGATTLAAMAAMRVLENADSWVVYICPVLRQGKIFTDGLERLSGIKQSRRLQVVTRHFESNWECLQGIAVRPGATVLFVIENAALAPEKMWHALEGCLLPNTQCLMMGYPSRKYIPDTNPPEPNFFYRAFTVDRDKWHTIQVACADCPQIHPGWIADVSKARGEDSDWFKARVLGEFPG